ncbi:phage tail protein [Leptolyngbya sp. FACHB-321]|uniref:phage baseplate assembly protein V n=1 Tax=Leptolyngbya sp. FACHB-321 TaxID=2692807 RepID=UPI001687B736|nr:phage baseplate assembly protein V [Leptolyngbya sp. FACHB-321]MBD2037661.1 phage tail protein [Leptolyngbya sp. FACHB-321]
MNFFDVLLDTTQQQTIASRIHGAVVGIVTNNQDPDGMGRVKVKFPWLNDQDESDWARITSLMAGKERGLYFLPEVDDEVLVLFEQGDVRFPYIIGALWNGKDAPPIKNDDGKNNIRLIQSRSGHVIRLNDENGKETIEIIDKSGNNKIVIDTSKNAIAITSNKDITLSAPQGTIKLEAKEIQLKSTAATKLEASAGIDIKANATMNLKGATINLN